MPINTFSAASDREQASFTAFARASASFAPVRKGLNAYLLISFSSLALALTTASECKSIAHLPSLLYGVVLWGWWGIFASTIWAFGRRSSFTLASLPKAFSTHVLVASAMAVIHLLLLGSLGFIPEDWRAHGTVLSVWTSLFQINRFGIEFLMYGFIFGIAGIVQSQIRAQEEAMKSLQLQRQLSAAHLRALQMQIEPHFLFNTLNAITTLVEFGRQKEAAQMLSHLNAILKSTLAKSIPDKIPLSQELETVENYLAIEQVRFADRLKVEIKVDPGALEGLVPCFLLQPIVENAIRHGIARCEADGLVEASAIKSGSNLHLRVRDSGTGRRGPLQNGYGIGLSNTRERLMHFYSSDYAMKAEPLDSGGFEVAITIPYERT